MNNLTLYEALNLADEGYFVTSEYFDSTQSLHRWKGKYYYEDGAIVSVDFLESQRFAVEGAWFIYANKENIDTVKLDSMHKNNRNYMLPEGSYNECIIKKENGMDE